MSKPIRWLRDQIAAWEDQGLVLPEQAARIRALYPEPAAGWPWTTLIFSGLGAVIIGLGVILVFAYNWEALPRAAKLAVVFLALASCHVGGLQCLRRADRFRQLGEALCLLGTMFFGAAIWLVAQAYHIEEHFPTGFLVWGLGALAMAWALSSTLQGLLAAITLAIWSGSEAVSFHAPRFWVPLFILAGTGLLAWQRRSALLLFVTLGSAVVAALIDAGVIGGDLVVRSALSLGAVLLAVGAWVQRTGWFAEGAWVWRGLGWALVGFPMYLLTFRDLAYELLDQPGSPPAGRTWIWWGVLWTPWVAALLAWVAVVTDLRVRTGVNRARKLNYDEMVAPLAATLGAVLVFVPLERSEWLAAGLFNLLFLLLTVAWLARGCQAGLLRPAVTGAVMLVALSTARYFDLFESLEVRGIVFLAVGAGLFATGWLYARSRNRRDTESGGAP